MTDTEDGTKKSDPTEVERLRRKRSVIQSRQQYVLSDEARARNRLRIAALDVEIAEAKARRDQAKSQPGN